MWDTIVSDILKSTQSSVPMYPPCFDAKICVIKYQSGLVPLSSIQKGDWIMDDTRWTQVIGVCRRQVNGLYYMNGNWMTDGVWLNSAVNKEWHHISKMDTQSAKIPWKGYNLITDSGKFKIIMANESEYIVRDFTEVGYMNLTATYTRVESAMDRN